MFELLFRIIAAITSPETAKLAEAVHNFAPREVSEETARAHAIATTVAETETVPAALLLSMAYSESRYNPYSVSHVRDGKRRWGIFKTSTPPAGVEGPYFCGVTQVIARHSWKKCMAFRDIHLAYRTAVRELTNWFNDPHCRNEEERMYCALLGYGGGYPAIKARRLTYPNRVLRRAKAFERAVSGNT